MTLRVSGQPSPAIIDKDFDLRILEETRHLWKFRNQVKVAGIDLHNRESSNLRMVDEHLSPGAHAHSNHQDVPRIWMECRHGVGADDSVVVWFLGAEVDRPVIHSAAINRFVGSNRDYPVAVFQDLGEAVAGLVFGTELNLLVESVEQTRRGHRSCRAHTQKQQEANQQRRRGEAAGGVQNGGNCESEGEHEYADLLNRPDVHQPESSQQAAGSRADNVREIEVREASASSPIWRDGEVDHQWKSRADQRGRQRKPRQSALLVLDAAIPSKSGDGDESNQIGDDEQVSDHSKVLRRILLILLAKPMTPQGTEGEREQIRAQEDREARSERALGDEIDAEPEKLIRKGDESGCCRKQNRQEQLHRLPPHLPPRKNALTPAANRFRPAAIHVVPCRPSILRRKSAATDLPTFPLPFTAWAVSRGRVPPMNTVGKSTNNSAVSEVPRPERRSVKRPIQWNRDREARPKQPMLNSAKQNKNNGEQPGILETAPPPRLPNPRPRRKAVTTIATDSTFVP